MGFEIIGIFEKLLPGVYAVSAGIVMAVVVLGIRIDSVKKDSKKEIETERQFREMLSSSFIEQKKGCGRLFSEIDRKQEKLDDAVNRIDRATAELKAIIDYFKKNGNGNGGAK